MKTRIAELFVSIHQGGLIQIVPSPIQISAIRSFKKFKKTLREIVRLME